MKLEDTEDHITDFNLVTELEFKPSTVIHILLLSSVECRDVVKLKVTNLFLKLFKFWRCSERRQVWIIKYSTKFEIVVSQSCP